MKQRFAVYDLIVDGVIVYVGMSKDDAAKRKLDAEMERYARNRAFMHELEELLKQEQ